MTLLQEENELLYIVDVDPKGSNFHRILYSQKQEIPSQREIELIQNCHLEREQLLKKDKC